MEQVLKIYENTSAGKKYNNIYLKNRYNKDSKGNFVVKDGKKEIIYQGLEDGNFVILTKGTFAEGKLIDKGSYKMYLCSANYNGTDVNFFLSEQENKLFSSLGGVGAKIKISLTKELRVNKKTGAEQLVDILSFELLV